MRYGSVCSGIEAASVAWDEFGWDPVFFAEIAPFPSRVLATYWPNTPNLGDFTRIGDVSIDLLVGGTPCQSFSVAGLRGGLDDDRGNLALEFFRLAHRARPRWILWENVPGVLSSEGGRDFGSILGALEELRYGWAYRTLDAQYFGVPQRRRRVFVVGCAGGWRGAAAVLFERQGLRRNPPPRRGTRETVAEVSEASAGSSGVARTLTTRQVRYSGDDNFIAHTLRGSGFDASEDGTGRGTPLVPMAFDLTQVTHPENWSRPEPGKPAPTLGRTNELAIAFSTQQDPSSDEERSLCLGRTDRVGVSVQHAIRRLTPLECERLQGFPDGYTSIDGASDSARYEALGNSMAVPVMRWIGRRIDAVDRLVFSSEAA